MRTWTECDEKTFDPKRLYEYHMKVYREMRPVYDAAIALHVAEHQYRELFSIRNDEAGVTEEQRSALLRKLECEELFDHACRRAKEGE